MKVLTLKTAAELQGDDLLLSIHSETGAVRVDQVEAVWSNDNGTWGVRAGIREGTYKAEDQFCVFIDLEDLVGA